MNEEKINRLKELILSLEWDAMAYKKLEIENGVIYTKTLAVNGGCERWVDLKHAETFALTEFESMFGDTKTLYSVEMKNNSGVSFNKTHHVDDKEPYFAENYLLSFNTKEDSQEALDLLKTYQEGII